MDIGTEIEELKLQLLSAELKLLQKEKMIFDAVLRGKTKELNQYVYSKIYPNNNDIQLKTLEM